MHLPALRKVIVPALAALLLGVVPATAAHSASGTAHSASAVTKVSTTVDVSCTVLTYRQSADWYFPSGPPKGLIWLQHGFSRANDHMTDLAGRYASAGYLVFAPTLRSADMFGCTLQNIGNNKPFLDNVATWFASADNASSQLARSYASAKRQAGRTDLGALPAAFVFSGHSAGAEAAEYVAQRLRAAHPAAFTKLRGLVLLDPVKSFIGNNTDASLSQLATTSLPILTVSAPGYSCNNSGSGTSALQQLLPRPFVGVRLTTGAHTDAEGSSTDDAGTLMCGTPQQKNVSALQTLAVGWAKDAFNGARTADLYPGGTYYASLLAAGTIQTLPGRTS
ncbi:alpha/beta hydrolase fold domain-containing protein [Streptomyces sp. CB03238]|uniref:alpha/beta hydrolase fold domain-containing protein n=1 Tax=Streptomyces sp. CB03238 TaxID=1907777 RepID=UPI000A10C130|nr:alpha/beta hydrolase fold domain-containing protein [Streptomyces sp. CB03238]ORT56351.1 hypothetical protein BKD26_28095 [Streptomyces sp. CB03238]